MDWSLPRTLSELHVIKDQELSFNGLLNARASVEHLSVVDAVQTLPKTTKSGGTKLVVVESF